MKRFALTICLAACLVLALGTTVTATDQFVVESKTVGVGSSGVVVGIFIENDVAMKNVTCPLALREIDAGSFITSLQVSYDNGGRLPTGVNLMEEVKVRNVYIAEDGACKNNQPGGFGGGLPASTDGAPFAISSSPAAALMARQKIFSSPLPAGTDIGGTASFALTLDVTSVPGQFEIDSTCVNPANHVLMLVEPSAAAVIPAFTKGIITIIPDPCPVVTGGSGNTTVIAGATATGNVVANDGIEPTPGGIDYCVVSGPGTVDGSGNWSWTPTCADLGTHTVVLGVGDASNACGCNSHTFDVTVNAPALSTQCSNQTVLWGATAAQTITATGGCPGYIYEVIAGPGTVDAGGDWSYTTGCGDVGTVSVTVSVEDAAGQISSCTFDLTVTNIAPVCANPGDVTVPNDGLTYTVVLGPATDGDGQALTYNQTSGPAWGGIVGNTWQGSRTPGDDAEYLVCFTSTDGCATSGECCFTAKFESPYIICFDDPNAPGTGSYVHTLGGRNADICVWVDPSTGSSKGVGGFDFLVCYDQSGLTFQAAVKGAGLHPDWEYFTWRTGMFGGNCGGACPDGYIRLVGLTDMNNGIDPDPAAFTLGNCIINLTFYVTGDQEFVGSCLHVGFCSFDCGDNVISSKDGNTLFIPGSGVTLGPDYAGCQDGGGNGKPAAEPFGAYCTGAICIDMPPDDRGDINLNGIANEIGDAVLFSNYFIYGSGVWDPVWFEIQIFSTEINNDGLTLTIADLVYLIRIITGDEQPFPPDNQNPKVSPYANAVSVISDVRGDELTVTTNAAVELGGAVLVYRYAGVTVGKPILTAGNGMNITSRASNGELRVLITPDPAQASGKVDAGTNDLITIPVEGDGSIELVESQFSDARGGLLTVDLAKVVLPTTYALHQNFPNPFNAGTVIPIALKNASDWSLTIYNVAGQVVRTFNGADEAGVVNVNWDGTSTDGSSVASGMYFYRAVAGEFTATKKMVVLK